MRPGGSTLKIVLVLTSLVLVVAAGTGWWVHKNPLRLYEIATRSGLERSGFAEGSIETRVGRQTYFTAGAGPTLVLLHGAGDQAGAWYRVAPGLADRYRVVVLDLAGHGDSDPGEGPLAMTAVVHGLEDVLADEGVAPAPVILVGNSMGAWMSLLYAEEHPERVERVVAVNGGSIVGEPAGVTLTPANREEARKLMAALRDPSSPPLSDALLDDIVRRSREGPIGRLMARADDMGQWLRDGRLDRVEVPVDLLWGASDGLMTLAYARRLEEGLPRARLTEVPNCGHIPQNECPERFAAALDEVLASDPPAAPAAQAAEEEPEEPPLEGTAVDDAAGPASPNA